MSLFDKNKRVIGVLFAFATLFSIFMLSYYFVKSHSQEDFINSATIEDLKLLDEVYLIASDGNGKKVKLPAKTDAAYSYSFKFTVPKTKGMEAKYVYFNLLYSSCRLTCGEERIYSSSDFDNSFVKSGAKSFNIIKIPVKYHGKELKIEFVNKLANKRKMLIPELLIGEKATILKKIIDKDFGIIVSSLTLVITGFFLFLTSVFLYRRRSFNRSILIIALFSTVLAFYIFTRSWIIYYYLDNSIILYFIEYISLILMPIPILLLFIYSFYARGYKNWRVWVFEILSGLIFLNFLVQVTLTLLRITEFKNLQTFNALVLGATFIFVILSVSTIKKDRYVDKYYMLLSILPLFVIALSMLIFFFKNYTISFVPYLIIAVMFFLLVHLYVAVVNYVNIFNLYIEKDFYEELAYFDILSSVKNRNAFKRTVEKLKNGQIDYYSIHLVVADMNGLKRINDSCGHNTGDEYIKETGRILSEVEAAFSKVEAYRYAGDEFVLICLDNDDVGIHKIVETIKTRSGEYQNANSEIPLSLAIGYDFIDRISFEEGGYNINKLFECADKNMYTDKAKYKEELAHEK